MTAEKIRVVEVGPRDGLQNEAAQLSVSDRVEFIRRLSNAGLKSIEAGAFVSSKSIPQMEGSGEVARAVHGLQESGEIQRSAEFCYLVPNRQGLEAAVSSGVRHVAIFGAVSETFSRENINCSIEESFGRFAEVIAMAKVNQVKVRGYLSTCFYCPYEGKQDPSKVAALTESFFRLGVYEVSIGDTIGAATPGEVRHLLRLLATGVGIEKVAMHFHDTRGTALANVLASYDLGVRVFDSSLGGLGGCPYAPNAAGNVATEDLVYMFHGMGVETGIDLQELVTVNRWLSEKWNRPLHSQFSKAGLPKQSA